MAGIPQKAITKATAENGKPNKRNEKRQLEKPFIKLMINGTIAVAKNAEANAYPTALAFLPVGSMFPNMVNPAMIIISVPKPSRKKKKSAHNKVGAKKLPSDDKIIRNVPVRNKGFNLNRLVRKVIAIAAVASPRRLRVLS
jgi:hypothetical protein